jgi:glycosyltransferase involved in cell wall biosynthesis
MPLATIWHRGRYLGELIPALSLRDERMVVRGSIDLIEGTTIRGWLCDSRDPDARIVISGYFNGREVTRTTTGIARFDVHQLFGMAEFAGFCLEFGSPSARAAIEQTWHTTRTAVSTIELRVLLDLSEEFVIRLLSRDIVSISRFAASCRPKLVSTTYSTEGINRVERTPPAKVDQPTIIVYANEDEMDVLVCLAKLRASGVNEVIVVISESARNRFGYFASGLNLRFLSIQPGIVRARALNIALNYARRPIIVLLDSRVQVEAGWVAECLSGFDFATGTAVVGGRLRWNNGHLAFAGGVVMPSGALYVPGQGEDAMAPERSFVSEVDWVSWSAMAVRRDFLLRVGGFNESYPPNVGADVDLCLKAKAAGLKVVMQPLANGIISRAVQSNFAFNEHAVQKHLVSAWGDRFPVPQASRMWGKRVRSPPALGRALVIDEIIPEPDRDAGSLTCFQQTLIWRDLGYDITFAAAHCGYSDPYGSDLQRRGIEVLYQPSYPDIIDWLERCGSTVTFAHVYRLPVASRVIPFLRRYAPQAKIVFSNADFYALRMQREAAITRNEQLRVGTSRLRTMELDLCAEADSTIVTSDYEYELIRKERPSAKVTLLRWIENSRPSSTSFDGRSGILFLGSFHHNPNLDGVRWFLWEIWRNVHESLPEVIFHIVGPHVPGDIRAFGSRHVIVHDHVPDLRPIMGQVRLSVAPLRFGAGFKGKIATSLGYGVPVVATSVALEGMGLGSNDGVLVADAPDAFAASILRVHEQPSVWERAARAGLDAVHRLYSPEAAVKIMKGVLTKLGLPHASSIPGS